MKNYLCYIVLLCSQLMTQYSVAQEARKEFAKRLATCKEPVFVDFKVRYALCGEEPMAPEIMSLLWQRKQGPPFFVISYPGNSMVYGDGAGVEKNFFKMKKLFMQYAVSVEEESFLKGQVQCQALLTYVPTLHRMLKDSAHLRVQRIGEQYSVYLYRMEWDESLLDSIRLEWEFRLSVKDMQMKQYVFKMKEKEDTCEMKVEVLSGGMYQEDKRHIVSRIRDSIKYYDTTTEYTLYQLPKESEAIVPAPDSSFTDLRGALFSSGDTVQLKSLANKEYMFIDLWYASCGYCIMGLPYLRKLEAQYGKDLTFVSVNVLDSHDRIQQFLKKYPFPMQILQCPGFTKSTRYDLGYPTFLILDKQLKVIHYFSGLNGLEDGHVEAAIKQLLGKK